ncbi:MAG: hypothetical protein VR78_01105 [Hoeflea sp. BRH_c9]|nr:MAG: hypothetical protein VR78_01105 [Hoeflea sp. BRH_c9]
MNDPITQGAGPEARYRDFLSEGRFMIQRSASTGKHVFYPRTMAPGTGQTDLEWVEASGRGTVYSFSTVRRSASEGGDHNIAIVELAEGPRTMTRVIGCEPDEVFIGMEVSARIDEQDGEPIVFFVAAPNGDKT